MTSKNNNFVPRCVAHELAKFVIPTKFVIPAKAGIQYGARHASPHTLTQTLDFRMRGNDGQVLFPAFSGQRIVRLLRMNLPRSSFRRRPESRQHSNVYVLLLVPTKHWIPACAGMTKRFFTPSCMARHAAFLRMTSKDRSCFYKILPQCQLRKFV